MDHVSHFVMGAQCVSCEVGTEHCVDELEASLASARRCRNMFPVLTLEVRGLEPEARYFVVMEICLSSDRRYKFVGAEWKATGKAEPQLAPSSRLFIHQDSPATGAHWMRETIKMKSAKLTNNPLNRSGHVSTSRSCADAACFSSRTFDLHREHSQLYRSKKFPILDPNRRLIYRVHKILPHLTSFWACWIQSTPSRTLVKVCFNIIIPCVLRAHKLSVLQAFKLKSVCNSDVL
jgi:hypothetical protein